MLKPHMAVTLFLLQIGQVYAVAVISYGLLQRSKCCLSADAETISLVMRRWCSNPIESGKEITSEKNDVDNNMRFVFGME